MAVIYQFVNINKTSNPIINRREIMNKMIQFGKVYGVNKHQIDIVDILSEWI